MKERFAGETSHRILLDTLKDQKIVASNTELAEQIAAVGELLDIKSMRKRNRTLTPAVGATVAGRPTRQG
jgi:hypothetical protein